MNESKRQHSPRIESRTLRGDIEILKSSPTARKIGAVAALSIVFGAGSMAVEKLSNQGPEFSRETTPVLVEQGDTLWGIAEETIEGINDVDTRDAIFYIENYPLNAEVFDNNQIDPGEILHVPTRVEQD